MASNGGEQHDLEKLVKWCDSLSQEVANPLAVYTMFLISPEAEAAQDVFRRFRSSFEARQAPFHQLIQFGRHGASASVRGLALGLTPDAGSIPALVLFASPCAPDVTVLPLGGDAGNDGGAWSLVLSHLESALDARARGLDLAGLPGVHRHQLAGRSVLEVTSGIAKGLV